MHSPRPQACTVQAGRVEIVHRGTVLVEMSAADARALADELASAAARADQAQREEWADSVDPSGVGRALNASFERLMAIKGGGS